MWPMLKFIVSYNDAPAPVNKSSFCLWGKLQRIWDFQRPFLHGDNLDSRSVLAPNLCFPAVQLTLSARLVSRMALP